MEVRREALETLGQLEPATLGQHADAVVARLEESDKDVRQAALMMLGNLEPTTLAQHSDAVVAMLYDSGLEATTVGLRTYPKLGQKTLSCAATRGRWTPCPQP